MLPINRNIGRLRLQLGIEQDELGAKLGLSKSAIDKWEHGYSTPHIERLPRVAELLGVSVDELLAEAA